MPEKDKNNGKGGTNTHPQDDNGRRRHWLKIEKYGNKISQGKKIYQASLSHSMRFSSAHIPFTTIVL